MPSDVDGSTSTVRGRGQVVMGETTGPRPGAGGRGTLACMAADADTLLERGRDALLACRWAVAESCFEQARGLEPSPEALDGLGQALYWQGQYPEALRLREQAYRRFREQGDHPAAAFVAVQLAQLHGLIHGNLAAVNGWLGHAERLLDTGTDCLERGWLELLRGCIAADPHEREARSRTAVATARRFGSAALEYDGMGYLGKALVELGAVEDGMQLIDEAVAAASSGVIQDPWAAGEIYCSLFHACEMVVDVRRAEGWLATVDGYVDRTGELPISAICRMHYGGLLTSAGRWHDAERELTTALGIYEHSYRGTRYEALLRLATLRVRQGRLGEAEELLRGHEDEPLAAEPYARLLLARGDLELAQAVLDRQLPDGECTLPLVPLVALRAHVDLARGAIDAARTRADILQGWAARTGQAWLRGVAARLRARVGAAAGDEDAVKQYEAALGAFVECGVAIDVATTRLELAEQLVDRAPAVARAEAQRAMAVFADLGAARDVDAAASLLRRLGAPGRPRRRATGKLTARQAEVLELLADGLSNEQIAGRLFISPRTAEHHVSNILAALGLSRRAEATAWALRQGRGAAGKNAGNRA